MFCLLYYLPLEVFCVLSSSSFDSIAVTDVVFGSAKKLELVLLFVVAGNLALLAETEMVGTILLVEA